MASERYAKFLKDFGPRVTELLDRLQKAAGVSERPMTLGDLDILAGPAEQNVMRTLHKLSAVGLVRLDKGEGRAYQPVVAGRRVHFEIDLLA